MPTTLKKNRKIITAIKIASLGAVLAITGCAGKIKGTVMPYAGGQYQSVSVAGNKQAALKITNNDAEVTCKKEGKDRYVVVSQEVVFTPPKLTVNTGNKVLDTLGQFVSEAESKDNNKDYEATTVFKCN